jgi:hypothetical protein
MANIARAMNRYLVAKKEHNNYLNTRGIPTNTGRRIFTPNMITRTFNLHRKMSNAERNLVRALGVPVTNQVPGHLLTKFPYGYYYNRIAYKRALANFVRNRQTKQLAADYARLKNAMRKHTNENVTNQIFGVHVLRRL